MIDRKVILMLFLTTLFCFLFLAFDLFVLSLCLNVFQCV